MTGATAVAELRVAVESAVDAANAPIPANAAERLVFQQLYEPLVRLDCRGRLVPGLAIAWREEQGGRVWSFTIRDGARFGDGVAVTARDIARSWTDPRRGPQPVGFSHIRVVDDRTLRIEADGPVPPHRFADPVLAVTRDADGAWPIGTAGYRVSDDAPPRLAPAPAASFAAAAVLRLEPVAARAAAAGEAAAAVIAVRAVEDARDAIGSADLIVTHDARAVAYAGRLGGYDADPLAWDRTYALVLAPDANGAPSIRGRSGAAPAVTPPLVTPPVAGAADSLADARLARLVGLAADTVRARLARDVVAGGARAAPGARVRCDVLRSSAPREAAGSVPAAGAARSLIGAAGPDGSDPDSAAGRGLRAFVYRTGDAAARGIAERLLALRVGRTAAVATSEPPPTARPAAANMIQRAVGQPAVTSDASAAYVVVLRPLHLSACPDTVLSGADGARARATLEIGARSPQLADAPRGAAVAADWIVVPLVDVRPTLIRSREIGGIAVDAAGAMWLGAARRFLHDAGDPPDGEVVGRTRLRRDSSAGGARRP